MEPNDRLIKDESYSETCIFFFFQKESTSQAVLLSPASWKKQQQQYTTSSGWITDRSPPPLHKHRVWVHLSSVPALWECTPYMSKNWEVEWTPCYLFTRWGQQTCIQAQKRSCHIIKLPHRYQLMLDAVTMWGIRKGTDLFESQLKSTEKCKSAFIKSHKLANLGFKVNVYLLQLMFQIMNF